MLRIRKEQMNALDGAAQNVFHQQLLTYLRREMPDVTEEFSDAALLRRIEESEDRAAKYGIGSNAGVAQFVCLTFISGVEFDEIPEVNALLKSDHDDPEELLSDLVDCLEEMEDGDIDTEE